MNPGEILKSLIDNALFVLDMAECCVDPFILSRISLKRTDEKEFALCLVRDRGDYSIWIVKDDRYIEHRLCPIPERTGMDGLVSALSGKEVVADFEALLQRLVEDDGSILGEQMDKEGIRLILNLIVGERRMDEILKVPKSCAISIHGQVFHGISGLEEYCRMQDESSSPYVLKRCHADSRSGDECRCYNYLVCRTKDEASNWMRSFIGIGDVAAVCPERIYCPEDFPPLICSEDDCGYMVLCYR